ncbi:MAG: porin [Halarcobacter sp.]
MKKFAKMSLVAAVAVAGFTSANAKDLSEAIKGVDVSGTVAYRYDDRDKNNSNLTTNSYKIAINTKSVINDDLAFNARTIIGNGADNMAVVSSAGADGAAAFGLTQANFSYTGFANTTIIAGKQAVPSPFAVAADYAGDEDTGNGLTVVSSFGAVTLAGTYLQNTNLATAGQAIAGVGILGALGPVNLDGWYLNVKDAAANNGHKAYTVGASANIEMVKVYGRYSAVDHDGGDKESLWKIGASAKLGIVGLGIDYGETNDPTGGRVTGVELTGDADADVSLQGWGVALTQADASLVKVNANADVAPGLNLSVTYTDLSVDAIGGTDVDEVYGQVSYKMGKNLSTYVRYGQIDPQGAPSGDRGRIQVLYTF